MIGLFITLALAVAKFLEVAQISWFVVALPLIIHIAFILILLAGLALTVILKIKD